MALTDDEKVVTDNIIDINLEGVKKSKFRINGDPHAIIELNLSDLSIGTRLEDGLKKLEEEMAAIANLPEDENISEALNIADSTMRKYIDYIFDSPVSEVVGKGGSMYDPINGEFRYEHIIEGLVKLYSDNLEEEYKKMRKRVQKHTDKYATKYPTTKRTPSKKTKK